jgi:hypothetical protein
MACSSAFTASTATGGGSAQSSGKTTSSANASGSDLTITTAPGGGPGLSGTATIDSMGDFQGAAITQGTSARTGCIGIYDATNTQCCEVVLTPKTGGC